MMLLSPSGDVLQISWQPGKTNFQSTYSICKYQVRKHQFSTHRITSLLTIKKQREMFAKITKSLPPRDPLVGPSPFSCFIQKKLIKNSHLRQLCAYKTKCFPKAVYGHRTKLTSSSSYSDQSLVITWKNYRIMWINKWEGKYSLNNMPIKTDIQKLETRKSDYVNNSCFQYQLHS